MMRCSGKAPHLSLSLALTFFSTKTSITLLDIDKTQIMFSWLSVRLCSEYDERRRNNPNDDKLRLIDQRPL